MKKSTKVYGMCQFLSVLAFIYLVQKDFCGQLSLSAQNNNIKFNAVYLKTKNISNTYKLHDIVPGLCPFVN